MKYFSFILVFSLLCINSSAQSIYPKGNKKYRLKSINYRNSLDEKGITILDYSHENKNVRAEWRLEDTSRYSVNYHYYDENGNFVKKYREFSDSLTSVNIYTYNSSGNLISDLFKRSDGKKGYTEYIYNKEGKKSSGLCKGLNGWFYGIIEYKYKGDTLKSAFLIKNNIKIGEIVYNYSSLGLLEFERWKFPKWEQIFSYKYEKIKAYNKPVFTYSNPYVYPAFKFYISSEDYDFNGENGGPSHYFYDDKGFLVKKIFERKDGVETVTFYEYDNEGILQKSIREYNNGKKSIFTYCFNERYQLLQRNLIKGDSIICIEHYFYNTTGNLTHALYNGMDSWLNGYFTFNYKDNKIISGKFNGFDGFNALLEFNYSKNTAEQIITWKFDFGKKQTYKFIYTER